MKLSLGVVHTSMLYRVDMGPARSDMMKLSLGLVHTSMLYRWTWGLHVRTE